MNTPSETEMEIRARATYCADKPWIQSGATRDVTELLAIIDALRLAHPQPAPRRFSAGGTVMMGGLT